MSSSDVQLGHRRAPWRVGRKLGRTIYERVFADRASDDDRFLGIMDDRHDAELVVALHNGHPDALHDDAPAGLAPVRATATSALWASATWAVTAMRDTLAVSVYLQSTTLDPATAEEMGRGLVAAHRWLAS